jgi:hypothetical protein
MKWKRIVGLSALSLLVIGSVAAAAIPGPQRTLAPTFYGLTEIAPGVFTDDLTNKTRWLEMKTDSESKVRAFFGELKAQPRLILCSHQACERKFGFTGATAVTFGWQMIHLPPRALDSRNLGNVLMAHERTHAELHLRMGWRGLVNGSIPNWFNEGLASHISQDSRLDPFYSPEQRKWIRGSKTFWDWGHFVNERGWRDAYGAAADNVARLDEKLGRDGLLSLIDTAIAQGNFEQAYATAAVE